MARKFNVSTQLGCGAIPQRSFSHPERSAHASLGARGTHESVTADLVNPETVYCRLHFTVLYFYRYTWQQDGITKALLASDKILYCTPYLYLRNGGMDVGSCARYSIHTVTAVVPDVVRSQSTFIQGLSLPLTPAAAHIRQRPQEKRNIHVGVGVTASTTVPVLRTCRHSLNEAQQGHFHLSHFSLFLGWMAVAIPRPSSPWPAFGHRSFRTPGPQVS